MMSSKFESIFKKKSSKPENHSKIERLENLGDERMNKKHL